MIVLDEQLLGRNIEHSIRQWYRGKVVYITELRPQTVIKDDAIPHLLQQQPQPTFVTINEKDFWQRVAISMRFCVVCFTLPDSRASTIPLLLRKLLRTSLFRTKALRMGHVIRVSTSQISYYAVHDQHIQTFTW